MVPKIYVLINKNKREKRSELFRQLKMQVFVIVGVLFSLGFGAMIFFFATDYQKMSETLPAVNRLEILLDGENAILKQPSEILDKNQRMILRFENPVGGNEYVSLDEIPQNVKDIFAVVEKGFFFPQFSGVSEEYLFAAYLCDAFLMDESDLINQDQLRLLSRQVQEKYSDEKVFEWYLNYADFGNHAYGIDSAAKFYFNKDLNELSTAEIALLAGISSTPDHNPVASPVLAGEREQSVLGYMILAGLINETDIAAINQIPIEISASAYTPEKELDAFLRLVMNQLDDVIDLNRFMRGGYQLVTTLDLGLQNQVICSTDIHFLNLSQTERVSVEGCDGARYIPSLRDSEKMIGASFEAKVLVLDTETGNVLAYLDQAPMEDAESGTILDPFVYLTGFSRGYTPSSMLLDVPTSFRTLNLGSSLSTTNLADDAIAGNFFFTEYDYHGVVNARESLRNGYSAARNDLIEKIGVENLLVNLKLLGILESSFVDEVPILENQFSLNFIDTSFAYSLFSNNGSLIGYEGVGNDETNDIPQIQANAILLLKDYAENVQFEYTPQQLAISGVENVFLVNDVLTHFQFDEEQTINSRAFEIVLPVGVQVSEDVLKSEQWAVGYSPKRLTAVWTKADYEGEQLQENSGKISPEASSYLLNGIVKYVHEKLNLTDWETPLRIVHQNVCYPSGNLPTSNCLDVRDEVFIQGDTPQQYDELYQKISINEQTGKLATIFTPQDYIEEKVFLVLPEDAKQWGYENEVVQPPSEYDFLFDIASSKTAPFIKMPENFSYVNDKFEVWGDVNIDGFVSYRVSIGQGLFPAEWELISENDSIPEDEIALASYDASGLNGLYILRLQVIDEENILSTAYAQVTIDTIKPVVSLITPSAKTLTEAQLNIQAIVYDEIGIGSVKFYLDDEILAEFSSAPFALISELTQGDHILKIIATDLAGNEVVATYPVELQ